ncbi:iron uptake transporter permease EfeU [Frondihabitans cladoniiphilus]|uniref:High-affinity iron transporter n=1 Tax=Frondihabitans cladoniiphilus TaxID=715785 RepID=A0ABP8VHH7_9MICO
MLATLVIGLREGLEATLIVGIIAAFLKRNRIPMWPMWLGVGVAVFLSVAVGVVLDLVEQALPQAEQEGMEAIIGAVAVVFVTTMIVWMRKHARDLKGDLEAEATAAAGRGTAWALAGMAFLAVLKEGFETSVFLLATFQASSNTGLAALGAVIGVAGAIVIGFGLYTGGVKLNLAKFFTGTGIFLVFVAAGLVMTALRTAHEAGWILVGQQRTVDLSWLAPNGTVLGALITGVLGIQPDPRVIEVLGWFCYLVPVLLLSVWPRAWRPTGARIPRVRLVLAGGLAVAALVLALGVHAPAATAPQNVALANSAGTARAAVTGSRAVLTISGARDARVEFPESAHRMVTRDGVTADRWQTKTPVSTASQKTSLTVDDLVSLFGRIPVGISPDTTPGPYTARWSESATTTLWTVGGGVLDTRRTTATVLTISGGGLTTSRTYTMAETPWSVPAGRVQASATSILSATSAATELRVWNAWLPIALGIAALWQAALALRDRRRASHALSTPPTPLPTPTPDGQNVEQGEPARSSTYAVQ